MTSSEPAPESTPQSTKISQASPSDESSIGGALGRVPSGLFIVSTVDEHGAALGFLASFVQQMGFTPPTVAVAVSTERGHLEAIRHSKRFAISVLGEDDKGLMKPFFKKPEDGSPFDELKSHVPTDGAPVLSDALAWLDCRLAGEHNAGDHIVVFGVVEAASKTREGEPLTHTRKNGLKYS
ncbi:MAG: flavin reductase (DIM6/NTAB) family NADH-FMN oxidoreductase RutF [Planctomycetota bacterium]|jgi:flavin reductase (DIM6/NTAB) family NADH-FMN oxidoreductase RutF